MRTLVFDISGPYGHFRKPYAPVSPVTYPFPPPPTVLGMIGAILGLGKDEYHQKLGWDQVRIGIRLLKPAQIYRTAINLVSTKKKETWCRTDTRLQIPHEFLKNPAYRIYVAALPDSLMDRLAKLLKADKTVYTPCLGLAQCLAETRFTADTSAILQPTAKTTRAVIPMTEQVKIEYESGHRYERVRVAARMRPGRIVTEYKEAVTALDAHVRKTVRVQGCELYRINDEHIAFF